MSPHLIRAVPAFSIAFAVAYVLATEFNLSLLTYHPVAGTWGLGTQPQMAPRQPAMYWYGWLLMAFVAALAAGAVAAALPRTMAIGAWRKLVWAVPLACMCVVLFMLRGYFLR